MSEEREVDEILEEGGDEPSREDSDNAITLAAQEVANLLSAIGDSLGAICAEIESAESRETCRMAFRRFNSILRIFLLTAGEGNEARLYEAVSSLGPSERFQVILEEHPDIGEAITTYKESVLRDLAASIQNKRPVAVVSEQGDEELFDRFLQRQPPCEDGPQRVGQLRVPRHKRNVADVIPDAELAVIPKRKRSSIPALNALTTLGDEKEANSSGGKKALLTRQKLRAGLHDPKGLLNLAGPSTNALDRAAKLELLKGAGYNFSSRGTSFYDKLNAANIRLDLGLGGHSVIDTRLFGAKVLSLPGFLSKKNVSDIENNVVTGATT